MQHIDCTGKSQFGILLVSATTGSFSHKDFRGIRYHEPGKFSGNVWKSQLSLPTYTVSVLSNHLTLKLFKSVACFAMRLLEMKACVLNLDYHFLSNLIKKLFYSVYLKWQLDDTVDLKCYMLNWLLKISSIKTVFLVCFFFDHPHLSITFAHWLIIRHEKAPQ